MTPVFQSLAGFQFGQPGWLLLLAALPLLLRWRSRAGPVAAVTFSSTRLVQAVAQETTARSGAWRRYVRVAVLGLIILALARPRLERSVADETAAGIDIMLVLDASRSMDSKDFDLAGRKVSRIEALHAVMGKFIQDRPRDRIGVIGFAEKPFLISPLTLDHSWMMAAWENVKTSLGTAIGTGVEAGVDLLVKNSRGAKVILLVTDGLNTSGDEPVQAAQLARRYGVRLYTIGVVAYDQMQTENLESLSLYQMAHLTGGQFFQAANGAALDGIYAQIDQLEHAEFRQPRRYAYRELYLWCVLPALVLLTGEAICSFTRAMRLP